MNDYKKDFIEHIKNKKEKSKKNKELADEVKKQEIEQYERVVTEEFLREVNNVVTTINKTLKIYRAHFWEYRELSRLSFTIKPIKFIEDVEEIDTYIDLEVKTNSIDLCSDDGDVIFEQLNDLGEMVPTQYVTFPQASGKETYDDQDIKEARDQFIRGAYRLAKEFN